MITVSKCSEAKFILLHSNTRELNDIWFGSPYLVLDDIVSKVYSNKEIKNRAGIIRSENNTNDGYAFMTTDKTDGYLIGDTMVEGVFGHLTQIFIKNGITSVYATDGKEHVMITDGEVVKRRKSGSTRRFISDIILKELLDVSNIEYKDGIVKTKNFSGIYTEIDRKYRLVIISGFHEKRGRYFYAGVDSREDYAAIIEIDTNRIIENTIFNEIKEIKPNTFGVMNGLLCCSYSKKRRHLDKIIDLRNYEKVLIEDININGIDGYYLQVNKPLSGGKDRVGIYYFDFIERKLVNVIPEIDGGFTRLITNSNKGPNIIISRGRTEEERRNGKTFIKIARLYINMPQDELEGQGIGLLDIVNKGHEIEWFTE